MTDHPKTIHHVGTKWRSLRLPGYDYRQPGAYYRIRQYTADNPLQCEQDPENPFRERR